MFRCAISAFRAIRPLRIPCTNIARNFSNNGRSLSTNCIQNVGYTPIFNGSLLNNKHVLSIANNLNQVPIRTVTKFSLKKGKRKTSKSVIKRFFRLDWGGWIRPKVGRQKRLWRKSAAQKRRLKQHVLCNATQSTLLDKMVTKFWKKPKYYVDDPYSPYHTREHFLITRKKPVERN